MNPQFPIYIVSKGRAESRLTARALDALGVPYFVVVEEQEQAAYASVIDPARVLVLPKVYQDQYDTFDALGDAKSKGPGPARNFAWEDSVARGFAWHWVMDDNISMFCRLNHNLKVPVSDGTIFRVMEDFVLRYENVAMAGPNYFMFASRKSKMPPMTFNTRIYSCNLIRNDAGPTRGPLPFRWRGRYNEDTDLSLRMLKNGWCTVLFNAFLQFKLTTQTLDGGNTRDFYSREGTAPKSRMLVAMHPDVARLSWRFQRAHHHVDYKPFKRNRLRLRPDAAVASGTNDYGMTLVTIPERQASKSPRG